MEVRAMAKQVRVSPTKVRLVLEAIRGRPVEEAQAILRFLPQPSARVVAKVLKSAMANAENNFQMLPSELRVAGAYAQAGPTLKRFRPRPRGRVGRIHRRTSHITVVVSGEE
ncbi:MAG: 50S ribosomal protein L22 [Chloroflexi bacterium]|nr:50S ribosomal protein L22 [Chloroflexota bacterium]